MGGEVITVLDAIEEIVSNARSIQHYAETDQFLVTAFHEPSLLSDIIRTNKFEDVRTFCVDTCIAQGRYDLLSLALLKQEGLRRKLSINHRNKSQLIKLLEYNDRQRKDKQNAG